MPYQCWKLNQRACRRKESNWRKSENCWEKYGKTLRFELKFKLVERWIIFWTWAVGSSDQWVRKRLSWEWIEITWWID